MPEGVLIGLIVLAVLACPAMMWLARRGMGPGFAMTREPKQRRESLDALRKRQRELELQIDELEADERAAKSV